MNPGKGSNFVSALIFFSFFAKKHKSETFGSGKKAKQPFLKIIILEVPNLHNFHRFLFDFLLDALFIFHRPCTQVVLFLKHQPVNLRLLQKHLRSCVSAKPMMFGSPKSWMVERSNSDHGSKKNEPMNC